MNTSKIIPLILSLVLAGFSANVRCDNTIPMSQQQIDNLGLSSPEWRLLRKSPCFQHLPK